jgi:hypothetical protein
MNSVCPYVGQTVIYSFRFDYRNFRYLPHPSHRVDLRLNLDDCLLNKTDFWSNSLAFY